MGDSIIVNVSREHVSVASAPSADVTYSSPGPQGPVGPQGTSGGQRYEEPFTAASVVVVNHNLGFEPSVTILIGGEEVDSDITHGSVNQFTVTFGSPQTGKVVYI